MESIQTMAKCLGIIGVFLVSLFIAIATYNLFLSFVNMLNSIELSNLINGY